jgi:hypothetical protein
MVNDHAHPPPATGEVAAYHTPEERVRTCALVRRRTVVTAYPEIVDGPSWPVELTGITPWSNDIEAQLTGSCIGSAITFFDTRYYANAARYRVGETYSFRMGALAYNLGLAQELEAEIEGGVKVSFKGAHAYLPASIGGSDAGPDEYWFHSPLLSGVEDTMLNGVALRGYPVALALPNDFEMALTVYAAAHSREPGIDAVAPGDDLTGYLWLQGYLSEP